MNITNYYDPDKGLMMFSQAGSQKYTENLDSYSQLYTDIYVSVNNNKHAMDSCWESGNIYYANYETGYVKKIGFDRTELASLKLTNPFAVSIIQYSSKMSRVITSPPQDDQGCWIADKGTGKVIKTDNELNILYELSGIVNPVCIVASIDGGCYIADASTKTITRISPSAEVLFVLPYASFDPYGVSSVSEMRVYIYDEATLTDKLWVVGVDTDGVDKIYGFDNTLTQWKTISPSGHFSPFSSSSSEDSRGDYDRISSIDVDRNLWAQHLYVAGGDSTTAWVLKYNSSGTLIGEKEYNDIAYPYSIKVVQAYGSSCLYLLEDSSKYEAISSSSSSSSSSLNSSSSSIVDTVTPDIESLDNTVWFSDGASFEAGSYKIVYTEGAMRYGFAFRWSIHGTLDTIGYFVVYNDGGSQITAAPLDDTQYNPTTGDYCDANGIAGTLAVENAWKNSFVIVNHTGGKIGVRFIDTYIDDNHHGCPDPTFGLDRVS